MIVNRRAFNVKKGCMEELVALLVAERERLDSDYRIYAPGISPFDVVVLELEFESLEEYETAWAEWSASPESDEFMEKFNGLTLPGGTNEVWTLA